MSRPDFAALLKHAIGLDATAVGAFVIDRAVRDRQHACGLSERSDYWQHVVSSAAELQTLVESVIVPETWFFRNPAAFTALTRVVRDHDRSRRRARVLRLLSLPCASGEEPYSMAMALLDAGFEVGRFQIDAVDISRPLIALAKEGVYGRSAFRGEGLDFRDRYFAAEREGHRLSDLVRRQVDVRQGNLFDTRCLPTAEPYDVIFCRNLLIYLDRASQQRAIAEIGRLLAPDGWLFVGSSESASLGPGWVPARIPMAFAVRRATIRTTEQPRRLRSAPSAAVRKVGRVQAPPQSSPVPGAELEEAQRLANGGRLGAARTHAERHVRRHGATAEAMYLIGLVHDASGDATSAASCYRKALYLDPRHQEALLHLALLMESYDRAEAIRLRARARRAAQGLSA
jgi:chemotaxis protein methyltransferase WspC